MERERKRTLLQKYEVPINHLDFVYIANCKDAREMEKIVQILRSGEEGYFPDLTKCAEDKLRELKPNSKQFRYEQELLSRDYLEANEWKPIYDWTHDIKTKDTKLAELKVAAEETGQGFELQLPPIRKAGKISQNNSTDETSTTTEINTAKNECPTTSSKPQHRIKSTDYRKWDQYDPDEEILRMDLAEERIKEEVERKNRLNLQKSTIAQPEITEIKEQNNLKQLADIEREKLAEEYRLRGNDYFRAKEYQNAIDEYTRAIGLNIESAAPAYNNRAIAYIKLQKFLDAIVDCEACLQLDPNNLKARLRYAEATYAYGRRRESYELYQKVLELDSDNIVALKATTELHAQLGDLPPPNATRIQIEEDSQPSTSKCCSDKKNSEVINKKSTKLTAKPKPEPHKAPLKEYDLAELIVPNRVVKNRFAPAAEALGNLKATNTTQRKPSTTNSIEAKPPIQALDGPPELRLPMTMPQQTSSMGGKILIEEI